MASGALFVEPITIATGGALTSTSVDGSLDPAAWDVAHTYATGDQATSGESIYQSLVDANTGNAVTDTTKWVEVSAINKMRMFDSKVGVQTQDADTIEVVITPGVVIGAVSVRNMAAFSVRVVQETLTEGVLFDRTMDLDDPVTDWFEYWFSDITYQTDAVFTGLTAFSDAVYTITVDNAGGTAKCGEVLMGPTVDAGMTEAGVTTGIDDYSIIAPDGFGVRDIVERDFAENMQLTVWVQAGRSATLTRLLTRNRARPFLLISSDARADAQVYGLAESWSRTLSYPDYDVFNIQMRGLT